jgi:hypothetical protein
VVNGYSEGAHVVGDVLGGPVSLLSLGSIAWGYILTQCFYIGWLYFCLYRSG